MMQTALLSIMFVRCQVKQNAEEEVQQQMNNEVDDILYFKDSTVLSLNVVHGFFQHHSCSQMRFVLCIFHLILVQKLFPIMDLS